MQVATINPVVTPSSAGLSADATSITIAGLGFDSNIANDSVNFDNGVTGSVTGATSTSLTVSVSGLDSVTAGTALNASVTVDGASNAAPVQVATINPVVTAEHGRAIGGCDEHHDSRVSASIAISPTTA